jgi:hypothetical protein
MGKPVPFVNVTLVGVPRTAPFANVTMVPFVVIPAVPPKDPELLYCIWVLVPPGDPPAPAGVAHVPSPRQKVEDVAPEPPLSAVTGNAVALLKLIDAGVDITAPAAKVATVAVSVIADDPPKAPEALYCTWVLDPPGVPPPPPDPPAIHVPTPLGSSADNTCPPEQDVPA